MRLRKGLASNRAAVYREIETREVRADPACRVGVFIFGLACAGYRNGPSAIRLRVSPKGRSQPAAIVNFIVIINGTAWRPPEAGSMPTTKAMPRRGGSGTGLIVNSIVIINRSKGRPAGYDAAEKSACVESRGCLLGNRNSRTARRSALPGRRSHFRGGRHEEDTMRRRREAYRSRSRSKSAMCGFVLVNSIVFIKRTSAGGQQPWCARSAPPCPTRR
jgi:hypothetical protein